ncbi:hypothetical protein FRACYDRAFT_252625 [Fragilariopsis cylindrus CCMP1102]|uniref:Exostosin GT47 domain-containing protein n=1 Tax=Fragilariopsis cylindrus CCMP1102 TaxID=635003 RepID=A0A1E7EM34_9STRA|nr:hypothetical protein FRACYDRAFT_252625 [Fragilariopsis cylindrus CCMP1102]|eukprot:OEU06992.1 hypothetical protein FRACYDRAFT_252625 [Fragilariopsis cylindrus CCMP1102]
MILLLSSRKITTFGGLIFSCYIYSIITSIHQHHRILSSTSTGNGSNGSNRWKDAYDDTPYEQQLLQQNVLKKVITATQSSTQSSPATTTTTTVTNITASTTSTTATAAATPLQQWEELIIHNRNITIRSVLDVPLESYNNNISNSIYDTNSTSKNSKSNSKSKSKSLLKIYIYEPTNFPKEYVQDVLNWFQYTNYDSNWSTDSILIKLFQSIQETIINNLQYYNNATKNRHLFLLSDYDLLGQPWFIQQPLLAMYGPRNDYDHTNSGLLLKSSGNKRKPRNHQQRKRRERERNKRKSSSKNKKKSPNGHIIIPQFNSELQFQPSYMERKRKRQRRRKQPEQKEQERTLSLVFLANDKNKRQKDSPRLYRSFLLNELTKLKQQQKQNNANNNTALIGGLPFISSNTMDIMAADSNSNIYDLYSKSIFCPILPGDITWQRRFFDVIHCGCIPVVISYPITINKNPTTRSNNTKNNERRRTRSWYVPENNNYGIDDTWSVEESYPFVAVQQQQQQQDQQKDQQDNNNNNNNNIGIQYNNFVIEIIGNETNPEQSITNLITTLNTLLIDHQNHNIENENDNNDEAVLLSETRSKTKESKSKSIIQQKQDSMKTDVGNAFLYGIGPDAHRTNDAFAYLIRSLISYIQEL